MTGTRTEQLTESADRPGACWMAIDNTGRNVGVIERAGSGRFGAFVNGDFIDIFDDIESAAESLFFHALEAAR